MRLLLRIFLCGLPLLGPGLAQAEPIQDFDRGLFAAVQHEGRRVMVIVSSRWSPTAIEQQPVLYRLSHDFRYPDVVFLHADFVRQKDVLRSLKVTQEDTVIVYRGGQERARAVGMVDETALRHLLDVSR